MTENTENPQKKAHLIKQPKPASSEIPPAAEKAEEESAERKKVVVVKKKVVLKKPQAKVVARHEGPGEQEEKSQQGARAQEEIRPAEKVSVQARAVPPAAAPQAPAAEPVKAAAVPAKEAEKMAEKPQQPQQPAEARKPEAPAGQAPARPQAPARQPMGRMPEARPTGRAGNLAQGPGERPYGRAGNMQGGRPGSYGGYQGRGGYGGYQGRPGGYQGPSSGGYQGPSGGYQGPSGYNRPESGPHEGQRPYPPRQPGPGGYQGQRPYPGSQPGGYPGSRPSTPGGYGYPRGPRPQGPGGRPGYGPQQGRPFGRPGGYGPRGPAAGGPPPMESSKTGQRKTTVRKKTVFTRQKDDLELEKALQLKKKAEARAVAIPKSIDIMENISVSDLAKKMNIKPAELIGKLMKLGVMATINQKIDSDTAGILADEYGCKVNIVSLYDETVIEKAEDKVEDLLPRAPIVTVMGHVDHGKTKLLDAIRKTDVVSQEFGRITQHIGAYQVETPNGKITFLDTPGHAAFTKMRARGSQITDIVILVVSAVEGVMPQTREALDHAKAAKVPIIVAINKIDLPESNPDRIKTQLSEVGLIPEEWGGTTQFCEISALQKKGITELLDAVLIQAEMLELKASYSRMAEGKIIESSIDQGRGIVATIIVERGTLKIGDPFVAGIYPGKVRAMFNDKGQRIETAEPATPVEVLGFEGLPNAGDPFEVVEDEKFARAISLKRQELKKYEEGKNVKKVTLDNLYETISAGEVQEFKVLIKGDVQGTVEALKGMLEKLSTKEIRLSVIRAAAGVISEDDVMMAAASDAIIIGFNVRPTPSAKMLADREKVDIRKYNIIYRAQEEIQKAMEGMLSPELKEQDVGKAEVRETFKVPKVGIIAGCYMLEGVVHRYSQVRIIRDQVEIFQGKISSLKRFKDDAKEVVAGYECGIGIENCNDLKEGDLLEIFETVEVARTLGQAESNGSDKA